MTQQLNNQITNITERPNNQIIENKENINQHWNIMKKLNKIYRNIKKMTQHQSKNKENRKNKRIQGQMTPDQL
jgi:hypothetical protein